MSDETPGSTKWAPRGNVHATAHPRAMMFPHSPCSKYQEEISGYTGRQTDEDRLGGAEITQPPTYLWKHNPALASNKM